jgi:hypothetical protein
MPVTTSAYSKAESAITTEPAVSKESELALTDHTEIVLQTMVLPTGATVDDEEMRYFGVTVEWRGVRTETGRGGYGVSHFSKWLSRAGNWGHPDKFQQRQYRWETLEEALAMAHAHVDAVTVNGRTFAQYQQFEAEAAATDKE